jgi:hypothetical protein
MTGRQAAPLSGSRFHTVWKRLAAAASNRIEQTREFLAAGKRENDVDTIGRELECHSLEVITPSVGGGVRAETAHERGAVSP